MALVVCVRTITRTITVRLYMIPMDTTSRRSATQHVKPNGIRANIWPLAEILLTSTNVFFGGRSGHCADPPDMSGFDPKRKITSSRITTGSWKRSCGSRCLCESDYIRLSNGRLKRRQNHFERFVRLHG